MRSILSFDLEDWNQLAYRRFTGRLRDPGSDLYAQLDFLLEVLAEHGSKATFFALGIVAKKYPNLIRLVSKQGHEIASHGYAHLLVHGLSQAQFAEDTRKSKVLLEDIVGLPVEGYRAPEFSICSGSLWALTVLAELGFKYDSSIFPIYHRRYGIPSFAPEIFSYDTPTGAHIVEIPLTVFQFRSVRLPVAGGGYFRLLPFRVLRSALRAIISNQRPLVTYFHPYEFEERRLSVFDSGDVVGYKQYFRAWLFNAHQNLGRRHMRAKLARLVDCFVFTSCQNFLLETDLHDCRKLLPGPR
jgi:polysaccharide deacetylase family protein (PEP-CTERM system associated)